MPEKIIPLIPCSWCGKPFAPRSRGQMQEFRAGRNVYHSVECRKAGAHKKRDPLELFLECVNKNGPIPEKCSERGPCWLWNGATQRGGYGVCWDGNKTVAAHRWAYEHFREPVQPELDLHHACENPPCCNPWHLDKMTRAEHRWQHTLLQTHCKKRRHKFTPENTHIRITKNGGKLRICRACDAIDNSARYHRLHPEAKYQRPEADRASLNVAGTAENLTAESNVIC